MPLLKQVGRELETARILIGTLKWTKPTERVNTTLVADDLEASVDRNAGRVAFRFEGHDTTYEAFDARANRYAHWALRQGLQPGDVVALFMGNAPDYVACWYGLSKVGVVTALINSGLTGASLAHCLSISGARHVICGPEQAELIRADRSDMPEGLRYWQSGEEAALPGFRSLETGLASVSDNRPDPVCRAGLTSADTCLMIYTSGTTGLPKAAKMSHMRVRYFMRSFIAVCDVTARDRVYVTLPLYHSTGGLCGIGVALTTGACVVLRRKFSASAFWQDAVAERVSVFVYIGELCRYLVNQPESDLDRAHSIRTGFGNGLRGDVWDAFERRFGISPLKEFYGSTEGNVGMMNFDGRPGAVGRVPPWIRGPFRNLRIVLTSPETGQLVRGPDGLCVEAKADEPGELVGQIGEKSRTRFEGYENRDATERKIARDVAVAGDAWFRTGDLMRRDADGYFYFVDRMGDTFRWKGENVSTQEVAAVIGQVGGVAAVNVYGVAVPGHDGRTGMAAITPGADFDPADVAAAVNARLPGYARPRFLRLTREMETTGTLKLTKMALIDEGFDPSRVVDDIYWLDLETGSYRALDLSSYRAIVEGRVRL